MTPLDLLLWAAVVALGATGLTVILRNAPIIRGWVFKMKKPWACNVCMPFYTCAAVLLVTPTLMKGWEAHAVVYLAAYLLSHVALDMMSRPPPEGPPPLDFDPDNLEDADAD